MPEEDDHQPHDKLFSAAFRVPENAAALLRAKLPPAVAAEIDWPRLRAIPGSFVDSQFTRSHTDLLFSAPMAGREGLLYVLFEHQSSLDRALPLRLLRYMTRIWEDLLRLRPAAEGRLPVILPVVLSQNAEVWNLAPSLAAMLEVPGELAEELAPFIPDFRYRHLQLAEMAFEAIPGTASGIVVLRVMKAERLGRLLDDAVWDERLLSRLPLDMLQRVLRYIAGADIDKAAFEARIELIEDPQTRSTAMTLAQRYHQDGLQEGLEKGRHTALQESILEVLEVRFEEVPEGLREAIQAVQEESRLQELHRAAVRCESLEAFAQGL